VTNSHHIEQQPGAPAGHLPTAEPSTRRRWLGAGLGAVGAAVAAALSDTALAAPPEPVDVPPGDLDAVVEPELPTEGDLSQVQQRDLMVLLMRVELAARDLYEEAITTAAAPEAAVAMSRQHRAYADAISGAIGESARGRNDALFTNLSAAFGSPQVAVFATTAAELENQLATTYEQAVALVDDENWIPLLASIAMMEARHAVVLGSLAGQTGDISALLNPDLAPLTLQELQ